MISKFLMGLLLAVLAYMVYMLMTCNDETSESKSENKESFALTLSPASVSKKPSGLAGALFNTVGAVKNVFDKPSEQSLTKFMDESKSNNQQPFNTIAQTTKEVLQKRSAESNSIEENIRNKQIGILADCLTSSGFGNKGPTNVVNNGINYENFENAPGPVEEVTGAEPAVFKNAEDMEETQYAKVNYTGLVDANPEDVLQIEGTDLLTAPLVDNMLYTNSIANTNRNASNDLRGDIPLQFNESYTPFYSSVIYGAPLSERSMTIGSLPQSGPIGPVGPFGKGITATA